MKQRKISGLQAFVYKNKHTGGFEAIFVYYNTSYQMVFAKTITWRKIYEPPKLMSQEGLHLLNNIPGVVLLENRPLPMGVDEIVLQYSARKSIIHYQLLCSRIRKNIKFHKLFEGKPGLLDNNTNSYSEFVNTLPKMLKRKGEKAFKVTLVICTSNPIWKMLIVLHAEFKEYYPLLDEIIVLYNGSEDNFQEIAKSFGVKVFLDESHLRCFLQNQNNMSVFINEEEIKANTALDILEIVKKALIIQIPQFQSEVFACSRKGTD